MFPRSHCGALIYFPLLPKDVKSSVFSGNKTGRLASVGKSALFTLPLNWIMTQN